MSDTPATPQEKANEPWRLLGTLPSTNWKTVSATGVLYLTTAVILALIWDVRARDSVLLSLVDSWLLFVGTAVLGIAAAQYVGKRVTFKPGGPDDKRSDAATTPSTAPVAASASDGVAAPAAPAQPVAPAPPLDEDKR
jgi:hypothetical protein